MIAMIGMTARITGKRRRMLCCLCILLGVFVWMPFISGYAAPQWPPIAGSHSPLSTDIVEIKFRDDTPVELHGDHLRLGNSRMNDEWERLFHQYPMASVSRTFSRSESDIETDRIRGEQASGQKLPDLNRYFRFRLSSWERVMPFIRAVKDRTEVEVVYPVHSAVLCAWRDPTPDFRECQTYLFSDRPNGPYFSRAWAYHGGGGTGITVADIEYNCHRYHEDLVHALENRDEVVIAGFENPSMDLMNHGTAVAGMLVGEDNPSGITGICPGVSMRLCYVMGDNIADAVDITQSVLNPGDVILLEMQVPGPNYHGSGQHGMVPVEYIPSVFDAIRVAVDLGRVVVEPAGNGSENLDDPVYGRWFDREDQDSGAILVGAGFPFELRPETYSNYGSRVDVHGWGSGIWTTGYGNAPASPAEMNRWYTHNFGGTSGASAMVAAAVACFQGVARAAMATPFSPRHVRQILIDTGHPVLSGHPIGPLPDIGAALEHIPLPTPTPDTVQVDLHLSQSRFSRGDAFDLWQETFNPGSPRMVFEYLVLECLGHYYFWDFQEQAFTLDFEGLPLILAAGISESRFLSFVWPDGDFGDFYGAGLYFCYLDIDNALVGNLDLCVFGWN